MDVRISPLVELKEARSEIGWLRNRNLILAQALHEMKERMIVRDRADDLPGVEISEADHADD